MLKSLTVSIVSPSTCHEVMVPDAIILVSWLLSFKPAFSLSSFTFKRLFSSSLLSAIREVSSTYVRLLIFLLAILIPACASSSPAFHMMYSAYKLNNQGDNIQPWSTPLFSWALKSLQMVTAAMKLRHLLLGRKAMTNLDSVLKSRDIPLLTKVCLVKAMVFPVVMYGYASWTIKKAEPWRIDAFELWCWRRLLRLQGDQTSQSERKSVLNIHCKDWCWS